MKHHIPAHGLRPVAPLPLSARPVGQARRRRLLLATTTCLVSVAAFDVPCALAGPGGGTVTAGQATISNPTAQSTLIQQSSNKAIIKWNSYSSAANESIIYQQPGFSSISLNKVTGGQASTLLGNLTANGQVWLVNPNGVFFGQGATVNVGGLLATTSDIRDQDFLAGNYTFGKSSSVSGASVVNLGTIEAAQGGSVVLSAETVRNEGVIAAKFGTVVLGGAKTFSVDFENDGLLTYAIGSAIDQGSGVKNSGTLAADGGTVLVTAKAASNIVGNLINTTGIIQANSVSEKNGTVILDAGEGGLNVGGTVSAAGKNAGESGGTITALGGSTTIADGAVLDASGQANGGFIETSGHYLSIGGAKVTTAGKTGKAGTWLLDPYDLTIDGTGAGTLSSALNAGGNVVVQTSNTTASSAYGSANASGNGDIIVASAVSWSGTGSLTLDAYRNLQINSTISHTGAVAGGLSLIYGDTAGNGTSSSSGTYSLGSAGRVIMRSDDALSIGGNTYTVVTNWTALVNCGNNRCAMGNSFTAGSGHYSMTTSAVLEGFGNAIDGYSDSSSSNVGMISANQGLIRDVKLTNVSLTATSATSSLGGLVAQNTGTIYNSSVSGNITATSGASHVGGLVGDNISASGASGSIISSASSVTVTAGSATSRIGGLAGSNLGSALIGDSAFTGSVSAGSGSSYVGGLVGANWGTISASQALGSVSTSGATAVGGLAGVNWGTIRGSYALGTYTAASSSGTTIGGVSAIGASQLVGGLVGYNGVSAVIEDSYTFGLVSGDTGTVRLGGLAGENMGVVTASQAYGAVNAGNGSSYIGGLIGGNSGLVTASAAYGNVAADPNSSYIGGLIGGNDYFHGYGSDSTSYGTGTVLASHASGAVSGGSGASAIGGLVGLDSGLISGSYATGDVSGASGSFLIGGLVGSLGPSSATATIVGTIASSYATGAVRITAGSRVGGLVGGNSGLITGSYATGAVSGTSGSRNLGGLVGANGLDFVGATAVNGTVLSSYATGAVNSTGINPSNGSASRWIGGLIGSNQGRVSGSHATGAVTGDGNSSEVGGLVGLNDAGTASGTSYVGSILSSYAAGAVGGGSAVGGLVGNNLGLISAAYAIGAVTGAGSGTNIGGLVGSNASSGTVNQAYATGLVGGGSGGAAIAGLVGSNSGAVTSSVWDADTTGQTSGCGAISDCGGGATAVRSLTAGVSAYAQATYSGWVFASTPVNGTWFMVEGYTRPFLASEYATTITNVHQLQLIDLDLSASYTLGKSISLTDVTNRSELWKTSTGFAPIGFSTSGTNATPNAFSGSLDGQNYQISDIAIANSAGDQNIGLFSKVSGIIRNLAVSGTVTATGQNAALLAGWVASGGQIAGSSASGSVTGTSDVGGLVGLNGGSISGSSASGSVVSSASAGGQVGGLAGNNQGSISQSISQAVVQAGSAGFAIGGLAGANSGTISDASATGAVRGGGGGYAVGGLVGLNTGSIIRTGAIGSVSGLAGDSAVGGLIGRNLGTSGTHVTVNSSFATGAVSGSGSIGGLVGDNQYGDISIAFATGAITGGTDASAAGGLIGRNLGGVITNTYATGSVTAPGNASGVGGLVGSDVGGTITSSYAIGVVRASGASGIGGLVGSESGGTTTNSYWDKATSGQTASAGGTGLATGDFAALVGGSAFSSSYWDGAGGAYPLLKAFPYVTVSVTSVSATPGNLPSAYSATVGCGNLSSCGTLSSAGLVYSTPATASSAAGRYTILAGGTVEAGTANRALPAYQIGLVPATLTLVAGSNGGGQTIAPATLRSLFTDPQAYFASTSGNAPQAAEPAGAGSPRFTAACTNENGGCGKGGASGPISGSPWRTVELAPGLSQLIAEEPLPEGTGVPGTRGGLSLPGNP